MTPNRQELKTLVRKTRDLLRGFSSEGFQEFPRAPSAGGASAASRSPAALSKEKQLDPIRRQALVCRKCRLCQERTHVVFGEGSLNASIVFVGEGPGRDEDAQGRPFIGAAGGLLTKMITAMGLTRESVYIANVVKCRPPMNRPPQPDEVAACAPYLAAQLTTISPKIICALGKTAAASLLQSNQAIAQMRGKLFAWQGIPVVVTFHPAYLLRNPSAKPEAWKDLKRVLALLAP